MNRTTSPRPAYLTRLALFLLTALAALALFGFGARQAQATTYFVATPSVGDGSGSSWSNAGPLQPILSAAHMGDQVWVKAGIYIGNFTTVDGVAVYGHFVGTETSISQRPLTNMTSADTSYLDGNNSGTVYTVPSAAIKMNTLDGFTVEEGSIGGLADHSNDNLVVSNCIFKNNTDNSGSGGGIYDDGLNSVITNCTFVDNTSGYYGGGIYVGNNTTATVNTCMFTGNSTYYYGGGIYCVGTITIGTPMNSNSGSTFSGNGNSAVYTSGTGTTAIYYGTFNNNPSGGVNSSTATSTFISCSFMDTDYGISVGGTTSAINYCDFSVNTNNGGDGGGIFDVSQSSTIDHCNFSNNYSGYYGGGIFTGSSTTVTISFCSFVGNSTYYSGGAIYSDGTPTIVDCTFNSSNTPDAIDLEKTGLLSAPAFVKDCLIVGAGKSSGDPNGIDLGIGGGSATFVYADILNNTIVNTYTAINVGTGSGKVIVANNILYNGEVGLSSNTTIPSAESHNDYYDNPHNVEGVSLGSTDLTVDPQFVDTTGGDYHLKPSSPMIDAGDNSYAMSSDKDLDGHARIQGARVDIGSYEFTYVAPPPPTWKATAVSAAPGGISHILWTRSDGAMSLWTLNSSDVETIEGPTYGPYPGWSAKAVATANDGTSRVLWTNTNGDAGVWTFSANDVETTIGTTYGPYSGWSAKSIGVAGDGTSRVLWVNTNGQAGVWSFNTSDVETIIGPTYGPYAGWSAKGISATSDYSSRVLWTNTNGTAGLWSFNANDVETKMGTVYGPYAGWSAGAVGTAGDGTSRVLWTNVNGEAGLWSFDANDIQTIVGPTYGPISGWGAVSLGVAADGTSRVLWDRSDRAAGVWTFNANDVKTVTGGTYGPY